MMITSKPRNSKQIAVDSKENKVELGKTTYLAFGALILIVIGVIAAQADIVQALPDHLFQKLRVISSNSQTY